MLSPNYVTCSCKKGRGTRTVPFERKILLKSPEPENKAQRKVRLWAEITRKNYHRKLWVKIITENYEWKLSAKIIRENYHLVYQWRRKVEIYRDSGVLKKGVNFQMFFRFFAFSKHYIFFYIDHFVSADLWIKLRERVWLLKQYRRSPRTESYLYNPEMSKIPSVYKHQIIWIVQVRVCVHKLWVWHISYSI